MFQLCQRIGLFEKGREKREKKKKKKERKKTTCVTRKNEENLVRPSFHQRHLSAKKMDDTRVSGAISEIANKTDATST